MDPLGLRLPHILKKRRILSWLNLVTRQTLCRRLRWGLVIGM